MANDNTTGAPTTGFGQNVSFTFDAAPGAPQLAGGDATGVGNFGVQGSGADNLGQSMGTPNVKTRVNKTLDFISNIADTTIANKFKEMQTQAYVGGMQQAMQGAAVKDVISQQPWWSKLFGTGDAVEGARAYTGNATAQLAAAQMIDDMPNMKTMDGPTAQSYYVQKVNDMMTGDPATDLAIQQGLQRSLPGVMRQQAKEHYAYTQQQAVAAQDASFKAGAANLQGQGANLVGYMMSPDELYAAKQNFITQQVPTDGQNLDTWRDSKMDQLIEAARLGQFHVIDAARNVPIDDHGTTLLSTLKSDQQAQVLMAIEKGQSQALKDNFPQYADAVSDVKIRAAKPGNFPGTGPDGTTTPNDVAKAAEAVNRDYMDRTGSTVGLFSGENIANMREGAGVNVINNLQEAAKVRQAALEKSTTAGQKALAVQQKNDMILASFTGGVINGQPIQGGELATLGATKGYEKKEIDYAATIAYRSMTPAQQQAALLSNRGWTVDPIATANDNAVQAALSSSPTAMGNAVLQQVQGFQALYRKDPVIAAAYYPKYAPQLAYYTKLTDEGVDPAAAFAPSFVNPIKPAPVSNEDKKAAIAAITDKYSSWFGPSMPPETVQFIANHIDTSTAMWNGVLGDPKAAATTAAKQLEQSGKIEVLGGYAWDANPDMAQRVTPYLTKQFGAEKVAANKANIAMSYDTVDEQFKHAVSAFINGAQLTDDKGHVTETAGLAFDQKPTHTILTQTTPLANGVPRWTVQAMLKDGTIVRGIMDANQVQGLARQAKASETNDQVELGRRMQHITSKVR